MYVINKNNIMKLYGFFILPLFLFIFLSSYGFHKIEYPDIKIQYDTLIINIKGHLGQIVKFNNKYYCFFERDNPFRSNYFRDFYVLSSEGKVEFKSEVSDKMNSGGYYDLFIRNDSILLKDYYYHSTYYFDTTKYQWKEIKEADDLIYEDENYYVYYLYFGEWGNTVWFKDKKTKKEYELACSFPKIHKIDSVYYLTTSNSIIKIDNPKNLKSCNKNYYYQKIEKSNVKQGSYSIKGSETLFKDTSDWFIPKFFISTSFVHNNRLYLLCIDSNSTYIGYFDSINIQKTNSIGTDMIPNRRMNSYRGDQNKNINQLLQFRSSDKKREGIIEIEKNTIRIINIINKDTAIILGEKQAKKTFQLLTDIHIKHIDNLFLSFIDSILPINGGNNVTPQHKIYLGTDVYPNKKKFKLETPRAYEIIEDSTITLLLNYYYSINDKKIRFISCEWNETRNNDYHIYARENTELKIIKFQNKLNAIINHLINNFGEPVIVEQESKNPRMEWKTDDGTIIKLWLYDFKEVRIINLNIYNE